jgi:uncharacterized membrane protein
MSRRRLLSRLIVRHLTVLRGFHWILVLLLACFVAEAGDAYAQSFTLSASGYASVWAGGSATTLGISITTSGGFSAGVALQASNVPTGVAVSVPPCWNDPPASGSTCTLTISAASTAPGGEYSITVTGTGGGVTASTTFALYLDTFSISASPASLSVAQGSSGTSTITNSVPGSFPGETTVSLSASGQPSGVTVSFSPAYLNPYSGSSSTMTVSVASTTTPGTYPITVTGTASGSPTHTTTVTLTVTLVGFTLSGPPAAASVIAGTSTTFGPITSTSSGGFDAAVTLSASNLPSGVTLSFATDPIAAPGSGTSNMTITASSTAPSGEYSITISGSGGGVTATTVITLFVMNFTLSPSPASLTISPGSSGTSAITAAMTAGPQEGVVTLSASGQPSGVTVSFAQMQSPPTPSGSATMTVNVASTTAAGTYPVTVTGTCGSLTHTTTVTVVVPSPSISSVSPTSGIAGTPVTISGTSFGSAQGSVKFNGIAAPITSWGNTSISTQVPAGAPGGNVLVTVTAASGTQGNSQSFDVITYSTTTTLSSSANPALYGTSLILSATVSASSGSTPTGTVLFYDGTTEIGSGILQSGNAAFTSTSLTVGTHSLTAAYQGNSPDLASTSAPLSQVIQQVPTTTSVTLSSTSVAPLVPIVVSIDVTDTVGIYPTGTANCTATGTSQTFSGSLSDGTAAWTLTNLTAGTYTITCSFAGSTDFGASAANPVTANVVVPTNTWTMTGSETTPTPISDYQTATLLQDGNVLIAGGQGGSDGLCAETSAQLYAPGPNGIGTFNSTGSMVYGRWAHSANVITVGLQAGYVLIVGGMGSVTDDGVCQVSDTLPASSSAELYSGSTFTLSPASPIYPRVGHTATTLQDGTILIVAGAPSASDPAEIYTPELPCPTCTNGIQPASFKAVGSLLTPTLGANTATLLYNGQVLIAGGADSNNNQIGTAELYNPVTQQFTSTGSLNTARKYHVAILLPNGEVLIAGGTNSSGNPTTSAELYNPTTGEFTNTGNMITARGNPGAALLNNGNVLIFGGFVNQYNQSLALTATSEIYNVSTGTFSSDTNLNSARQLTTSTALPGGNVLAIGGGPTNAEVYSLNETMTSVINPKYLIMGITYAPPGPSSSISYTDTNYVGNTTDITLQTSQTNGYSLNASAQWGKASGAGASSNNGSSQPTQGWSFGSLSVSGNGGEEWTQTNTTENSFTSSGQTSNNWQTAGTANAFAPVDHDYDTIWLWLNPTIVLTVDMSNPNAEPVWNGYGYDATDPVNGIDIYPVLVGNLNGDIPSPEITQYLERGWAANEDLIWPNGDTAALNPTDYANILAADPFTDPNYTVITPSPCSLPCTTTDGRFTTAMSTNGTAESIPFVQAAPGDSPTSVTYTETYANSTMSSKTVQNQTKISWSVSASLSGTFYGVKVGLGGSYSGSLTTTNTTKTSTTTTNTQTTAAKIVGPTCTGNPCNPSYSGVAPLQPPVFDVYQDSLYGGMMFFGVN